MKVQFHPHARDRLQERGATEEEVATAIERGERFSAKYGRSGFRSNFLFNGQWNNRHYRTKQVEVYAVEEDDSWLVITVVVKFF